MGYDEHGPLSRRRQEVFFGRRWPLSPGNKFLTLCGDSWDVGDIDAGRKRLKLSNVEKEMATHSSTLAWKIPWMEERGRLYSPWALKKRLHFHRGDEHHVMRLKFMLF